MRVDAHHHVWQLDRGDYGWLQPTPALRAICRDFALDELRPWLAAAKVGATVLVQAAPTLAETRYLLDVARSSGGLVRGVVGWADLAAADAIPELTRLAADPLLKSVRPMLQDLPDPDWITRPEVQPALAALPALGLRFEALVTPRELKPLAEGAAAPARPGRRRRSLRQAGYRGAWVAALGRRPRGARAAHRCVLQTLRPGHGSRAARGP